MLTFWFTTWRISQSGPAHRGDGSGELGDAITVGDLFYAPTRELDKISGFSWSKQAHLQA